MCRALLFLITLLLFFSCDREVMIQEESYVVVNGDTLHVTRFDNGMFPSQAIVDGECLGAQGCAIKDNYLYRFYNKGYCMVFLINEDFSLSYVKEFKLASYKSGNHMNGVQFYPNSDILYSSEFYERNCNVEKVILSEGKSEYLQKIVIEDTGFLENCKLNIICGDDGFLWVFGAPGDALGKMHFVKFRCPDLSLKEVTIGRNEVLEHWMIVDDIFMQGGKIKNGYLYFVSGSAYYKKRLMVFNIHTKTLYRDILLNDIITEEPEDCDIINNKLIITVCGGTSYYVIDL